MTASILADSVQVNGLEAKAKALNIAAGAKNGCCELTDGSADTLMLGLVGVKSCNTTRNYVDCLDDEVSMTTLDSFVEHVNITDVKLLKIDVEGLDGAVIEGARRLIARSTPDIVSEMVLDLKTCTPEACSMARFLDGLGYKKSWLLRDMGGISMLTVDPDLQEGGTRSTPVPASCNWTQFDHLDIDHVAHLTHQDQPSN